MTGSRIESINSNNNVYIGTDAGKNNTSGENNVALGKFSQVENTSGEWNVSLGNYALRKNTTGDNNTAIGTGALDFNTSGNDNTALGYGALNVNTTGVANAAAGFEALVANTTGSSNTAFGYRTLFRNTTGTQNVGLGQQSLYYNSTGLNNISVGYRSGYNTTTGDNNLYLGHQAGYSNQTGDGNVMIGYQAGYSETGSNKLYIDNTNTSSPLIYGDFNANELTVNGTIDVNGTDVSLYSSSSDMNIRMADDNGNLDRVLSRSNPSNDVYIGDIDANGGKLVMRTNGANRVTIGTSGNMVTQTIYPYTNNSYSLGLSSNRWTAVYATNGTIQTSDVRFKNNINNLNYGLNELMQIRSVSYNWKDDSTSQTKLGFIAQELEQIVPEVVSVANDSMQTRGVNYAELIPVLVKAIQEQQEVITNQKLKIKNSENANIEQNKRLADLEAQLSLILNATTATK